MVNFESLFKWAIIEVSYLFEAQKHIKKFVKNVKTANLSKVALHILHITHQNLLLP